MKKTIAAIGLSAVLVPLFVLASPVSKVIVDLSPNPVSSGGSVTASTTAQVVTAFTTVKGLRYAWDNDAFACIDITDYTNSTNHNEMGIALGSYAITAPVSLGSHTFHSKITGSDTCASALFASSTDVSITVN